MLLTDEKIVEILLKEKNVYKNPLLKFFKISYPNNTIAQMSNTIFVGVADYETTEMGFDFNKGNDLVDILVVTKKKPNLEGKRTDNEIYNETKFIIKSVLKEIRKILLKEENIEILGGTPKFRNITPEYNPNYVLSRGHMLVQLSVIDTVEIEEDEIERVCNILLDMEDIEYE